MAMRVLPEKGEIPPGLQAGEGRGKASADPELGPARTDAEWREGSPGRLYGEPQT